MASSNRTPKAGGGFGDKLKNMTDTNLLLTG